jgi:GrpB-like predicted nucleotidyltransferase (UPF0157 family)
MTAAITIEDYDPGWAQQFESLRSRIALTLGPLVAAIEHVGSTAVPGLAAKPIIDLDVLLRSDADLPLVIGKLELLGYQHQGDLGIPGREAFQSPPDEFPHHLYVCLPESLEFRRHLAFRNHLRDHPDDADAYSRLKRDLAATLANRDAYTQAKSAFVEQILYRAKQASVDPDHGTFPVPKRIIP